MIKVFFVALGVGHVLIGIILAAIFTAAIFLASITYWIIKFKETLTNKRNKKWLLESSLRFFWSWTFSTSWNSISLVKNFIRWIQSSTQFCLKTRSLATSLNDSLNLRVLMNFYIYHMWRLHLCTPSRFCHSLSLIVLYPLSILVYTYSLCHSLNWSSMSKIKEMELNRHDHI